MSSPLAHEPDTAAQGDLDPHHALPAPSGSSATVTDPAHLLPAASAASPARGSWIRKVILLALVLSLIGFSVWRIRSDNAETAAAANKAAQAFNRPTPVLVSVVQQRTVPMYLTALGTVTAYNTVTLDSRVDGQLLRVNFQEGQAVRQGQLLMQIDPRGYQAAVAQAEGQLAKDTATQKNAQAEAQRYTALYQAGVVSKESQQTQLSNAGQAAGSIQADNAAIQAAKVTLSYTNIYSPINGIVGLRAVDPGNIVRASDTAGLVTITQIHPIAVIFTLPEDQLPQVQQAMRGGAKLTVEAHDRNDSHILATGKLLTIDNQIDTTTGTAKLKAVFDNADDGLFPNQFVNVRLIIQERQNAIVIPTAAIQSGITGSFVFVVRSGAAAAHKRPGGTGGDPASGSGGAGGSGDSNAAGGGPGEATKGPASHAEVIPVHVDFAQGANSILAEGSVKPGDQVVIDGQEKLSDGSAVIPQQGPPPAGAKGIGVTPGTANDAPRAPSTTAPSGRNAQGSKAPGNKALGNGGSRP